MAASGVAWSLRASGANSASVGSDRIIDVHAHYYPPVLKALGLPSPMNAWSLQKHLEEMDAAGVTRSLLSLTTPGVTAKGDEGRKLTREANEYGAKICGEQRDKLGLFTYVQLDDLDGALSEIAYGFDVLKAQGVGLFTSYGNRWLGDPEFDPVFAELDRRKAVVYVHPTSAACCGRLIPGVFDTLIEYGTDTTRAIASFVYRGAARRFPNVRMVWSHSGGTMPYLIERFDGADRSEAAKAEAPEGFRAAAAKFFYDIAQASNPVATAALRKVIPVNHVVFGTDYPFRTPLEHVTALKAGGVFNRTELRGLFHGNVEQSLPELMS
jgi:predicted TIM-barrel fold metal-dependent hydrolase